jgi:hypothetical protein
MEELKLTDYLVIVLGIWFAAINVYLFKTINTYKRLTRGSNKQNLEQIITKVIKNQQFSSKRIGELTGEVAKLEDLNKNNFQKFAIIRFNPFEDSGGDQSFVAAFLNDKNSGIVLSSLHSRNGTRVYAKQITNGKASSHQLSKEEKEVIEKASGAQKKN